MTKEELAARLDGRQYGSEISEPESDLAKRNGLVVVYGASDDLMEFEGAIHDEVGANNGAKVYVTPSGIFEGCKCKCVYSQDAREKAALIKALWAKGDYSWQYETAIPHATFEVVEGDEKYCRGIVFHISDAQN